MASPRQSKSDTDAKTSPSVPPLSAQMKRLRLRFLKSVKAEPLDNALEILRSGMAAEKEENARLGSLAAQTWLIRERFNNLGADALPIVDDCLGALDPTRAKMASLKKAVVEVEATATEEDAPAAPQNWQKVKILEETVVNGMRFFKDFVIEVNEDDAKKLVEANKAEIVAGDTAAAEAVDAKEGSERANAETEKPAAKKAAKKTAKE